jgi:hypothetical protein
MIAYRLVCGEHRAGDFHSGDFDFIASQDSTIKVPEIFFRCNRILPVDIFEMRR